MEQLEIEINRKLFFTEMEVKLVDATFSLMVDRERVIDDVISTLIELIELFYVEQQIIMKSLHEVVHETNE
ncbi:MULTISPECIES: hypothetical protein [Gracilibacillus]|uniref:hypothetical protein n=1 Tax=Gracilibacillus TaxID=74385 RepID=UPI000825F550|nr:MULTISPECIES: hypothetical protein [Gracilibacillus]